VASAPTFQALLTLILLVGFFRFGGDQPLYKVQFLMFCNPLDIPVACFTNSSPKAFLSNLLVVLSLPSYSCCLKSQFLVPVVPSWNISYLLPSVHPFRVPLANLFWSHSSAGPV
jgi:hypothetical protein